MNTFTLDTNYLIRYFTKDIKAEHDKAKKLIESTESFLYIPNIVVAETTYILKTHYIIEKPVIYLFLKSFINKSNIKCERFVATALDIFSATNISLYDAIIIAETRDKEYQLKTFDKKMNKIFKSI